MSASAYSWLVGQVQIVPEAYRLGDDLHDWTTGQVVPWKKERMLMRLEDGSDYWTWLDPVSKQRLWVKVD